MPASETAYELRVHRPFILTADSERIPGLIGPPVLTHSLFDRTGGLER